MKNTLLPLLLMLSIGMLLVSSCNKEEELSAEDIARMDQEAIAKYLSDRGLESEVTASGLHYIIEEEGNGTFPTASSTVTVNYVGKLTDGGVFDQSTGGPVTFSLTQVIAGWTEGIPLFSEGGSGLLLIPSALGYGTRGSGSIPPNEPLVFEVELIEVE